MDTTGPGGLWLTSRLHAGPAAYGLVLTAMGAGSLAGNLLSSARWLARLLGAEDDDLAGPGGPVLRRRAPLPPRFPPGRPCPRGGGDLQPPPRGPSPWHQEPPGSGMTLACAGAVAALTLAPRPPRTPARPPSISARTTPPASSDHATRPLAVTLDPGETDPNRLCGSVLNAGAGAWPGRCRHTCCSGEGLGVPLTQYPSIPTACLALMARTNAEVAALAGQRQGDLTPPAPSARTLSHHERGRDRTRTGSSRHGRGPPVTPPRRGRSRTTSRAAAGPGPGPPAAARCASPSCRWRGTGPVVGGVGRVGSGRTICGVERARPRELSGFVGSAPSVMYGAFVLVQGLCPAQSSPE
ncbi:hypothetical protein HNP84_001750 [Thermocatellispora tengchongensis]|uniref:Uncharacterized protein n=1 Tax=Thermocatellispora tengchongensis TaxID=1073253 RepID=A0A840P472_9ACTN|nr:hypothetical protein [Thermocatellispora tengchongensis]